MAAETATGVDLTVFNDILKEFYIGPIRDQLNSKTILLHRIARNEEDVSGRIAVVPLRIARNEGHNAIAEGGFLADPQSQGYDRAEIPMRFNYGRVLVNGPTIAASRNERGAFTQAIESEIYNMVTDLKNEINRQLFGDGAATLCQINGTSSTTTHTCDNPYGFAALNSGAGTRFLRVGMVVGAADAGTGANNRGSAVINTVPTATTFTTATSVFPAAATDNQAIFRASRFGIPATPTGTNALSHAQFREMMGISGIIDNVDPPGGDLQAIDFAAGSGFWQASVLANGGVARPLDLDLMQQAIDNADIEGDGVISLIITNHALHRKYQGLVTAQKRFVNTMELDGGFRALEYNDIPIVYDKDAPNNRMYFVDEDTLAIYRMSDFFWLDKDGSVLHRLNDKDAYQATLALYAELGTSSRNRHSVIRDLDES